MERTEKSGYSGYEWFVAYLYLKGSMDIFAAEYPERFLSSTRMMVPERWLEDYDRFWQPFAQKRQEEELEELARRKENVETLFQKVALVRTAFHRIYGQMEPEKIRRVAKELVIEEWSGKLEFHYTIWDTILAMDKMVLMSGLTGRVRQMEQEDEIMLTILEEVEVVYEKSKIKKITYMNRKESVNGMNNWHREAEFC